ncbi:DUF4157 domain-containing protein [Deinococcus cavernae]|uniref:DUF4157 domain-containing protein n=1 Tax=Deinococcus cavernae TaxID=2320857 RepID=A0A418VHR0_9DEIO|nr:DUF4157 domain-containing protein [Deinococcus cavernae]RJF75693.1 DUF4157 domain-containing protein [Deinococcus cavernae]
MTFVRKPRMAKLTQRALPQPFLGRKVKQATLSPEQVKRQQLRGQLRGLTQQFTTAQNQAVTPIFQAVKLEQTEHQYLLTERTRLTQALPAPSVSIADLQVARERQQKRQQPAEAPLKPATPDDWVTVMKAQARQADGRAMSTREFQQFTALQQYVARTLVQAYRQDPQPADARTAQFAARLATLHDHPASRQVAKVVLSQLPQAEQPILQRAVDDTVQREAELRAHDDSILQSADAFEKLATLDVESRKPLSERIQARRGAGNPLPEAVRRHLEQGLNHDLSRVRIHDDTEADKLAKGVNAIAFTTGTDIFFQKGKFSPNTQTGLELLAHEVAHTVQQSQGKVTGGIDANPGLEQEAQAQGKKLAQKYAKDSAQPSRKTKSPTKKQSVKPAVKPARPVVSQQSAAVQRSAWGADWWRQFVNKGADQALELAAKVPNGAAIVAAFKSNKAVFQKVIANPRPFFVNLIGSVKNGFLQFKNQIGKHLQGALMDWLAGTSIAGTGRVIVFPKSLTGRELLGFGMDVLGLNYAGLLTRLGKKYGAEKVRKAEGQLALLQQAKGGLQKLNDFRHMDNQARDGVITAARNYALQSVAQQAVVWASSFAASGGLIPVAKTAFNLISTILQNASTFKSLGQTVLGSIADIANGRTAAAANKVEQNLVRVMGLVMKFLSKMLGLDKISGAIRKGLAALQKPINTVIDRIVASKPVAAFFSKFQAGKQAVSNAVQQGTRNIWAALRGAGKSLTGKKQVTGTQHHLWVEIRGESPVFIMASNPLPLREQLVQMEKEAAAFLSGPEKAKVDKAQAAASALVDQGVKDMLDYIRTRPRNPNPAADEAWLRANAQVIRGKLKTIGQATITKVNATIAPAVQILDKHVMPVKDLTAVVKSAGGIVDFLTTLASGGKVGVASVLSR